jgi:Concanavalin A-like lectin/glucanases superfamily
MPIYTHWQSKPWPGVAVDPTHPLAASLVEAWPFAIASPADPIDVIGGRTVTVGSVTPTVASSPDGPVIDFGGANNCRLTASGNNFLVGGTASHPFTLALRLFFRATISNSYGCVYTNSTGAHGLFIKAGKLDWFVGNTDHVSTTVLTASTWNDVAVIYDGATLSFYLNGLQDATTFSSASLVSTTLNINTMGCDSAAEWFGGQYSFLNFYNVAKSLNDLQALFRNPWQIYQPQAGWLFNAATVTVSYPINPFVTPWHLHYSIIEE